MREIKFRAWDKKNKFMDDGPFWVGEDGCVYDQASITYNTPNQEIELNEHLVLMQFTGLKDKNGLTDIYEGDILEFNDLDDYERGKIVFQSGAFQYLLKDGSRDLLADCKLREMSVIGNIYENPELIKETP